LLLHDTTEFSYQREDASAIGITKSINRGRDKAGSLRPHTVCDVLMHSSLVVMAEGLPLGLAAVKFWTRKKFKGTAALKKKINPTCIPIERKDSIRRLEDVQQSTELFGNAGRCVHIGDRESDIYEPFCAAREAGTHFLIRTCVDRLAGDGDHTIGDEMDEIAVKGLHRIQVRDSNGDPEAVLEIRYSKMRVLPPIGKRETPSRAVANGDPCRRARHTEEEKEDRVQIHHRSAQLVPHGSRWGARRYGRVFWMTMLNHSASNAPTLALTATEIGVLDRLVNDKPQTRRRTLSHYLIKIA
jgi:hypothetical protein